MTRLIATLSIILVALVLLTGWLVWYGPSDKDTHDRLALVNNSLVGGVPGATTRPETTEIARIKPPNGLHLALSDRADIMRLTSSDELVLYNQETGILSKYDTLSLDDQSSPFAQINPGAKDLAWSVSQTKLIAHYIGSSIYYDFEKGVTHSYPSAIQKPVFDFETDNMIVYSYIDRSNVGRISWADSFVDSFKNIASTRLQNVQLRPLTESVVAIWGNTAPSKNRSSLGLIQRNTGELKTLVVGYENLEVLWAPSNTQLLYSVVKPSSDTVALYYLNAVTGARRELPVSTIANKCLWQADEQSVICAVPDKPITRNTYHGLTNDSVVRINPFAQNIAIETLVQASSLDIRNIIFSELNNTLFMNDRRGSGVYRFVIKD